MTLLIKSFGLAGGRVGKRMGRGGKERGGGQTSNWVIIAFRVYHLQFMAGVR